MYSSGGRSSKTSEVIPREEPQSAGRTAATVGVMRIRGRTRWPCAGRGTCGRPAVPNREEQALEKRRPSVILPGQGVTADGFGQGGDVDLQRWTDGEQADVQGDVVAGAGGQTVPGIQALAGQTTIAIPSGHELHIDLALCQ
jgi:hypothetical protein